MKNFDFENCLRYFCGMWDLEKQVDFNWDLITLKGTEDHQDVYLPIKK